MARLKARRPVKVRLGSTIDIVALKLNGSSPVQACLEAIRQCVKRANCVSIERRAMHESKGSWLQHRELANVGSGRWTKASQGKKVFCLHCGANDIAGRKGWATAKPCKEVAAKESTRGLFEYNASIPSVRNMWRINIANSFAS